MTLNGWLQIALMLALVAATARPLGLFMAAVMEGKRTFLHPALRPVEGRFYALAGADETRGQSWFGYAPALSAQEAEVYLNESYVDGAAPVKARG